MKRDGSRTGRSKREGGSSSNDDSGGGGGGTSSHEDPFLLIEKGNSLESSHNQWGSSDYYSRASAVLLNESIKINTLTKQNIENSNSNSNNNSNTHQKPQNHSSSRSCSQEERKIAALYHDQSVEYLSRARQSLIGALMFEREEDLRRWGDTEPMVERLCRPSGNATGSSKGGGGGHNQEQLSLSVLENETVAATEFENELEAFTPLMNMLSNEEMDRRVDTFRRLFVAPSVKAKVTSTDGVDEAESDLKVEATDEHEYNRSVIVPVPDEQMCASNQSESKTGDSSSSLMQVNVPQPPKNIGVAPKDLIKATPCNKQADEGSKEQGQGSSHCSDADETSTQNDVSSLEERLKHLVIPSNELKEAETKAELTLEQRLAKLDSSLPREVLQKGKSDVERLENIKSGLDSLGVYLPSQNKDKDSLLNGQTMTDEEQVQMIMNMAKDEVALEKKAAVDDDGESDNEAIEDLLKRSGIRIELPEQDMYADDDGLGLFKSVNPMEEGNVLLSSVDNFHHYTASNTNNPDPNVDLDADADPESDDDWSKKELTTFEDIKCVLAKSQQMLLQASVCLEEIDEKILLSPSSTLNEGGKARHGGERGDEEEGNKKTVDDEGENTNSISSVNGKEDILDEEQDGSNVAIYGDDNGGKSHNGDDCEDAKNELLNEDNSGRVENKAGNDEEIEDGTSAMEEKPSSNHDESSGSSSENVEHKRIQSLGKESLIKAHAYLEQIINAWPDEMKE